MKEGRIRPSFALPYGNGSAPAPAAMKEGRIRPSFAADYENIARAAAAAMKEGRIRPSFPLIARTVIYGDVPQ